MRGFGPHNRWYYRSPQWLWYDYAWEEWVHPAWRSPFTTPLRLFRWESGR